MDKSPQRLELFDKLPAEKQAEIDALGVYLSSILQDHAKKQGYQGKGFGEASMRELVIALIDTGFIGEVRV